MKHDGREHRKASRPLSDRDDPLGSLIRQTIDPLQMMQRVADQMLEMVSAADGVLIGLVIDGSSLRYVCGSGHLGAFVGETMELRGSLSGNAIRCRRTLTTEDTETDGRVNRQKTRAFGVRSSVCVPLGRGEEPVGILNVSSRRACAFDDHDVALLDGLAEFVSTVIGAATELMTITARLCGLKRSAAGSSQPPELRERFVASVLDPEGAERFAARERVEHAMRERRYEIVFQPIFDLRSGTLVAAEALARFDGCPYRPPDEWLADARTAGLAVELEVALVRAALEQLDQLPPHSAMTLNADPAALASPELAEALEAVDPRRVVVELTEHCAVEDYPALSAAMKVLRSRGVRLAIDDAGAGYASLMHILRLAPDFIKLDRQLISEIDLDPVRRALAASLRRFAEETGAILIAEGVETASELAALDDLGIGHAQGFFLARPAPVRELAMRRPPCRPPTALPGAESSVRAATGTPLGAA